ncbi:hypothetical protein JOD31_003547 [Methylopila capsulata]|uniref:Uncharacterized protein n=1 Tax=Methylopila capsulata TaxID=61654 RepID=A0A9W6IWI2_9HYPH|nr:hypothetical protein [Methylopila capsulata]MBM7853296.1 hypothetical protein [Methylopila capsulata]GLK57488.1 hypothetical protein GCM10008170_35080 [Methylopila capsulata]
MRGGEAAAALGDRPLIPEALTAGLSDGAQNLGSGRCAGDFAHGRSVVVEGWVLSEVEASLCAGRSLVGRVAEEREQV